ncbi:MAG: TonB-dependent receptor [Dysgonomonadaceae bacterium]|nr:TonB-dependent receptor [Dysgonamonadaceae bacterium]
MKFKFLRIPYLIKNEAVTGIIRIMKISFIFLFIFSFQLLALNTKAQDAVIELKTNSMTVGQLINEIEKQTDYLVVYSNREVDANRKVDVQRKSDKVSSYLNEAFSGTDIGYDFENNYIVLMKKANRNATAIAEMIRSAQQQGKTITGKVVDVKGEPIIGANIIEVGTTNGTVTDIDGNFSLKVADNATIRVSYIGYLEQDIRTVGQNLFSITLLEDVQTLQEVVAVGYGTMRKKLITGATSQVGSQQINRQNPVSVIDALKSSTTGLQIVKTSGEPGSDFRVNIRGLGTTGDATPLFIVDGVPVSNINYLNPSDIESIDILKDAASSSIYGSRAANGVILVATKSGNYDSKPTISYDGYYGVQNLYKKLPTLNAQEYAILMNEARLNDGLEPYDYASLVPNWEEIESGRSKGTDWFGEIMVNNAPIQNHSLNINGGTDKARYSMGFSLTSQNGILGKPVASSYDRYNFRLNTEYKIFDKEDFTILKIGENLSYSYIDRSGIATGGMYSNSIRNTLCTSPFMPVFDENGEYHFAIPWDIRVPNPIAIMVFTHGNNTSVDHKLLGNVYIDVQPIKNLTLRSTFGYDFLNSTYRRYTPKYNLSERHFQDYSSTSHNMYKVLGYNFENTINYLLKIGETGNTFDILAGNTVQNNNIGETIYGTNINSIFDDLEHAYLDNSKLIDPARTILGSYPWKENKLLSYFGRVNYDYLEKYLLTVVMRADGSSKFAKGKRWGFFPSVAAGWVISEESFWENLDQTISFFKLRASWGENGNQNISPFQYLSTISFSGADYYGINKKEKLVGAYPDILPNPDVTWETSEQLNIGFDSYLFNNRLTLNFDWYIKNTKNWLVAAPTLASYGTGAPFINGGDVQNRGFEIAINWNNSFNDLNYSIGVNLSHNKNEVTRIANQEKIIHGPSNVLADLTSEIYRAEEGYPIGYFWGYKTDGIFQNEREVQAYANTKGELIQPDATPGDVRFVNMNDDNIINDQDKVMIGDPNPDFTFGLSLGADYKGFDFSLVANGVTGNQIMQSYRDFAIFPTHNFTTDIFGRWYGEGTSNRLPKLSTASSKNFSNISDLYVENGDYLRISSISVGYDFSKLLKKDYLNRLHLYLSIQNLYTFTKYSGMDPEVGYSGGSSFGSGIDLGFYPSPRTVLVGLNVTF